jgi:hypothetical protein
VLAGLLNVERAITEGNHFKIGANIGGADHRHPYDVHHSKSDQVAGCRTKARNDLITLPQPFPL